MDLSVLSIILEIGAIGLLLALGATVAAIAIAWLFGMVLNPDLALRGLKYPPSSLSQAFPNTPSMGKRS